MEFMECKFILHSTWYVITYIRGGIQVKPCQ